MTADIVSIMQKPFRITSICRDDLMQIYRNHNEEPTPDDVEAFKLVLLGLDDVGMKALAEGLEDDYCEQLFWDSAEVLAEELFGIVFETTELNNKNQEEVICSEEPEIYKTFPMYAKMGETVVKLLQEKTWVGVATYYRVAGMWECKAHWIGDKLTVIEDAHFTALVLEIATKEEHDKDNAGYITNKVVGHWESESGSIQSLCRVCKGTGLKHVEDGTELCDCQEKDIPENDRPF